MLLCPVNKPAPALLAQRMNETPRDGLGEYLVAGIKALRGHDPQGKLTVFSGPLASASLQRLMASPRLKQR